MSEDTKHLLLYDGECGLCSRAVQFVLKYNKDKDFCFAPLQGEAAKEILNKLPSKIQDLDTVILVQDYSTPQEQIHVMAKGAFRTLWLFGGAWKLIGWMSFLPPFLFNWGYRLVARSRYSIFGQSCLVPRPEDRGRFLP